jgi:L-ascorbate metabolism protein UlaG (beta-lactamase superfamily)
VVTVGWCGHSCVYLRRNNGYTIVIDPHDGYSIGLQRPSVKGDLILVTHEHFDHNAVDVVKRDDSRVLREYRGIVEVDDIKVEGFKTYHDKYNGRRRGENTAYIITVDDARIGHLGDIGEYPPPQEIIDAFSNLGLLAIPVGGVYTIDPEEAWKTIEKLHPKNILPIHYLVKGVTIPLYRLDDFLAFVKNYNVTRLEGAEFTLEEHSGEVIIPSPPILQR